MYLRTSSFDQDGACSPHNIILSSYGEKTPSFFMENTLSKPPNSYEKFNNNRNYYNNIEIIIIRSYSKLSLQFNYTKNRIFNYFGQMFSYTCTCTHTCSQDRLIVIILTLESFHLFSYATRETEIFNLSDILITISNGHILYNSNTIVIL